MAQKHEYVVMDMIESAARNSRVLPVVLGGFAGPGGGIGGPPGGFIGLLPQSQVTYDTTEAATLDTVGSGTLVDNLNHIRYRLGVVESGAGAILTVQDWDGSPTVTNVDTIIFSGVVVSDLGDGNVLVAVTASGGGIEEAPLNGLIYGRQDGEWVSISGSQEASTHDVQTTRFYIGGRLVVLPEIAGAFVAPDFMTISGVYITCDDTGTAGSTIVDVNKNGSTIFSTQANRPTLAYNDADEVAKSEIPDVIHLQENDKLTIDIDQVATNSKGLSVIVSMVNHESEENLTYSRFTLVNEIWSNNGLPTSGVDNISYGVTTPLSSPPTNLASIDRYTINMDDNEGSFVMASQPWIIKSSVPNGKLALVHQGHTASLDSIGVGDTIRALVDDGFDVVAFLMPDDGDVPSHDAYPSPTATLNYLKFFIEPVVRVINQLRSSYSDVYMTGLSGGGWTTHLSAAVDARISKSVAVAGSLPLAAVVTRDWEQYLPGLTVVTDYPDLYVMAADKNGRTHVQLLNENDSCCFSLTDYGEGPDYDASVTAQVAALGGTYDLIWDSTHSSHLISSFGISTIQSVFGV